MASNEDMDKKYIAVRGMIENGDTPEKIKSAVDALSPSEKDDLSVIFDKEGHSLLSAAVKKGNLDTVKALIEGGLSIPENVTDKQKKIDEQAEAAQKEALRALLDKAKKHLGDTRTMGEDEPSPTPQAQEEGMSFQVPQGGGPQSEASAILSAMDTSGDGLVSYAGPGGSGKEFDAALNDPAKLQKLMQALDEVDGKKDGKVTKENLETALAGSNLSKTKMGMSDSVNGLQQALQNAGMKLDASGNFNLTGDGAPAPLATGAQPAGHARGPK